MILKKALVEDIFDKKNLKETYCFITKMNSFEFNI